MGEGTERSIWDSGVLRWGILLWEGHTLARSSGGDPLAIDVPGIPPLLSPTVKRSRTVAEAPGWGLFAVGVA